MKRLIFILAIILISFSGFSQSSSALTLPNGTNHLGWDDTGNTLLWLNQNNQMRTRWDGIPNWTGINGETGNNVNRITLPHDGSGNETVRAWSMLHLWEGTLTNNMYRNWYNIGTSYTGNSDFMYTGLMERADSTESINQTDAIVGWGCNQNPGGAGLGPDNLRFVFLSPTTVNPQIASATMQGLEVGRFTPFGNFGIGDFSQNGFGLDEQPTHRLDVAGTVRIRQLLDSIPPDVLITGINMDTTAVGDYELHFLPLDSAGQYLSDKDWEVITNGVQKDVVTGHGPDTLDWPNGNVGVGVLAPFSRVDVLQANDSIVDPIGVRSTVNNSLLTTQMAPVTPIAFDAIAESDSVDTQYAYRGVTTGLENNENFGMLLRVTDASKHNFGVFATASAPSDDSESVGGFFGGLEGEFSYGIQAEGNGGALITYGTSSIGFGNGSNNCYGVYTVGNSANDRTYGIYAEANEDNTSGATYGVYCTGYGSSTGTDFAIFADGEGYSTVAWNSSDENLKTDIEPIEGALSGIMQLEPKEYTFQELEGFNINLPSGEHSGILAQDLEEVYPHMVKEITTPEKLDSLGNIVGESISFKAVNYQGLIPVLISGMQEQQALIEDLQGQISECCLMNQLSTPKSASEGKESTGFELKQNRPNPFRLNTLIEYEIFQQGKAKLLIQDANGKDILTAFEGVVSEGVYNYRWNAEGLPSGIYYYILFVDDEIQMKKAVKL